MDEQGGGNQKTCRCMQIHAYMDRTYRILTRQYPIDTGMYDVSICKYFCKYLQVLLSRYVEIDQFVFDNNTYAILTNRFTDGGCAVSSVRVQAGEGQAAREIRGVCPTTSPPGRSGHGKLSSSPI
jgi:hypothetical protein